MPLIQIRHRHDAVGGAVLVRLQKHLPAVAAEALSCVEGGKLAAKDIMLEFDSMNPLDINGKDIHIRVWAHDYPTRAGLDLENLDTIRKTISAEVLRHIAADVSWYVWVLLAPTSYGSDTEG